MRFALIDVPFKNTPELDKLNLPNYGYGNHLRSMTVEVCKQIHDIGFRIISLPFHPEASDSDIEYAKQVLDKSNMLPGPPGAGISLVHPEKNTEDQNLKIIAQGLRVSGKLGADLMMISGGSMNPTKPWTNYKTNHLQSSLDRMVENAKKIAPVAEKSNVVLCPETTQWTVVNNLERMQEFVDRVDSPFVKITFDPVNHMTPERVWDTAPFIKSAIATLGSRIGNIHCKDVTVDPDKNLISHIDEAPMGTGLLDHETLIRVSDNVEPYKMFCIEHIRNMEGFKKAYDHIQGIANRMGHKWTDPTMTREKWLKMRDKK